MKTLIIAEAGVNHNGSFEIAKKLIFAAKEAGADIVKFQTFIPELCVSSTAAKAAYQEKTTGAGESQLEMVKKLALPLPAFVELKQICKEVGIGFFSTAFDFQSIEFLHSMGEELWKIPSGEITNLPFLIRIARYGNPVILSTGMSTMGEVGTAIRILQENGCGRITLLHCTTEYPAPYCDVNLSAMQTMKAAFNLPVGYSDHTQGISIPIAAVALGATVIEKHFTLDRNMEGPDHSASLEPCELKAMVSSIRQVEAAMGNGIKEPSPSEKKNIPIARKSIVAGRHISMGEPLTEDNLALKRPGDGLSPMLWFDLIGQKACKDFEKDEQIIIK